jgi:hypothetical protein
MMRGRDWTGIGAGRVECGRRRQIEGTKKPETGDFGLI